MRIKSYFADSVQEAIDKARLELGPDAMLMNSKTTDHELRALGSVEVVFGLPSTAAPTKPRLQLGNADVGAYDAETSRSRPRDLEPVTRASQPSQGEVAQELAELRQQIESVKRSLIRQKVNSEASSEAHSRIFENICARLLAFHIAEDLAQEVAEAAELQAFSWNRASGGKTLREFELIPSEAIELALSSELERRFRIAPELGAAGREQKVVLLAGPAGAGKTTALIKIALRYGVQARLSTHLLSLDTLRVGGWEQLGTYARIAGLGFDPVHNLRSIESFVRRHQDKDLILIDTPGFGPADEDLAQMAEWARRFGGLDTHLVLPATLRRNVLERMLDQFKLLSPSKLLVTHADEMESTGVLVDMAMRADLPLSYVSNGPTIPEDLYQPDRKETLGPILQRKMGAKEEAA